MKNYNIPFAQPEIGAEEKQAVVSVLDSGWLTGGPVSQKFEKEFASYIGAKYALSLNSATAGLHLALHLQNPNPTKWVITTPFTFAASSEVIRYSGAHPLFVDIDKSYCINRQTIEDGIKKAKKIFTGTNFPPITRESIIAIIPVHYGGLSADMDGIRELAAENNWAVIEDAAHSFPTKYKGKMLGSESAISVFSFYATKSITTGEGGMLVTNKEEIVGKLKKMRLHGLSREAWKREGTNKSWLYDIEFLGYKYNMNDIAAAIGLEQLKKADRFKKRRQDIASYYDNHFKNISGLSLPPHPVHENSDHCYYLYPIHLDAGEDRRSEFIHYLKDKGIGTSVHFIPLYRHTYYKELYPYLPEHFPETERVYKGIVSLPIYSKMNDEEVEYVASAVSKFFQ